MLRKFLYLEVRFGIVCGLLWIGTHSNPADAPSRYRQLPARGPLPVWTEQLWGVDGKSASAPVNYRAREYFAGTGGLTQALRKQGISCLDF